MTETITIELIYGLLKQIQDDVAHIRQQIDGRTEVDPKKPIRVIDKTTEVASGLSEGITDILDDIKKAAESLTKGNAGVSSPPNVAARLHRREPSPTPDQIRAAERALSSINRSLKRGGNIDASDLRNLPKNTLERIRDGGDEYLVHMCQNWEIQQREKWGRERGRELGLD